MPSRQVKKVPPKKKGAHLNQLGIKMRLRSWFKDHKRVARESFHRVLSEPVNSLMTWAVIGIALALPVGLYVALGNIQSLGNRWEGNAQISLFMNHQLEQQQLQELAEELAAWPEIDSLNVIGKAEALEEFQQLSGFSDVLSHLDDNPLPEVIEVQPVDTYTSTENIEALLDRLQALDGVDLAQLDLEWVQRLSAMLAIGQRLALLLVILLSAGVLLIIGNTIRLEIENRRQEVIVIKLVGGTDAFVRRPFLYTGIWYGIGGGLVASLVVATGLYVMDEPVARLAGLYQANYKLLGLSVADLLSLWLLAGLLGFFGAWFSVTKHLDALQPT